MWEGSYNNYLVLEVGQKVIAEAGLAGTSGVWEGSYNNYLVLEVEQKVIAEAGLAGTSGVWEGSYKKVVKGSPPKTLLKDTI